MTLGLSRTRTLLFAQRDSVARLDFEGREAPRVVGFWRERREAEDEGLDLAVEHALRLGGPLRGPTWLLADEVHALELELDGRALRGLDEEETGRVLALEAQVHTGVANADSLLAWRPVGERGGSRSFALAQLPRTDFDFVRQAVRRAGGELRGVAHPAGLPRALSEGASASQTFVRFEDWGSLQAAVARDEAGAVALRLRPASARSIASEQGPQPTELLSATSQRARGFEQALVLEDEAILRRFGALWIETLAARLPSAVVLRAPPRPPSPTQIAIVSSVLALLVVLLAALDHRALRERRAAQIREIGRLQASVEDADRTRNTLIALRREVDELESKAVPQTGPQARWTAELAPRWLELLAARRPAGLVLDSLELDWQRSAIRGLAVDAASVDLLAAELQLELNGAGYELANVIKRHKSRHFEFELAIVKARDVRSASFANASEESP